MSLQREHLNEQQTQHSYLISFTNHQRIFQSLKDEQKQVILNIYQQDLIDSGVQHRINISQIDFSTLVFSPDSFHNQLQLIDVIARNLSLKNIYLH